MIELDETHAALGEATRQQAVGRKRPVSRRAAVAFQGRGTLAAEVRQLRHAGLHAERQLVLCDARGDLGIVHEGVVLAVESVDGGDVGALLFARDATWIREVVHGVAAPLQLHALKTAWQKPTVPLAHRYRLRGAPRPSRHHHDEAGEIFRLAAEPIVNPRAHARAAGDLRAGVHEHVRRIVVDRVCGHRAHEAKVVDHGAEMREQGANFRLVLPKFFEGKLRGEADEFLPLQLCELLALRETLRHGLAMHRRELRLRVERLKLRRTARHRQPNHALGLLRQRQGVNHAAGAGGRGRGGERRPTFFQE
jgi:hypothetical protein